MKQVDKRTDWERWRESMVENREDAALFALAVVLGLVLAGLIVAFFVAIFLIDQFVFWGIMGLFLLGFLVYSWARKGPRTSGESSDESA
jgi:protein-S-isoprenylcysteine O-methyltransferase Ste14